MNDFKHVYIQMKKVKEQMAEGNNFMGKKPIKLCIKTGNNV